MKEYKTKYRFEVGARSVADYLAAWRGGADRVELYASPLDGALTPSAGLVRETVKARTADGAAISLSVNVYFMGGSFRQNGFQTVSSQSAAG